MLRLFWACALVGSILLCREAAARQKATAPQTFTISGTVVEHSGNRPLGDAIVTIAPVQQADPFLSARTGEDGRFVFTHLSAGKYRLSAQKRGFSPEAFQEDGDYSTAIAIGPGLDSEDIVFPLSLGGSITGTVMDEENEPVRQARVMLFSKEISSGAEQTAMRGARMANSSGEFRFPDLKAGTYFVAVQARPWYAENRGAQPQSPNSEQISSRELDVVYAVTYSGGVTDPEAASPITLAEGGTSNVQFVLRAVPALHIEVTGLSPKPDGGVGVNAMNLGLGGFQAGPSSAQVVVTNEHVEITGIAPGRYIIAPFFPGQGRLERIGAGIFDLVADGSIDIGAFNRSTITGRITFEGESRPRHPTVVLRHANSQLQVVINVAPDGSLQMAENSPPLGGRYEIGLHNAPGFYLKSLEAKGAALSGRQVEISYGSSMNLSLIAGTGVTTIDGVALKGDKGAGGAMVLLLPKDSGRPGLIRRDQSDSDGTFTLPEVAPGRYTLVAIDNGHDLGYQDTASMKRYLGQGVDLTAPLTSGAPVKVTIQPRQQTVN